MSTHSTIAVVNKNGTVTQIYNHSDGYVSHTGNILKNHYNTFELASELVALGALSYIQPKLVADNEEHSFDDPVDGVCIAYHRDRGEPLETHTFFDYQTYSSVGNRNEYNYLFNPDGNWYVSRDLKSWAVIE